MTARTRLGLDSDQHPPDAGRRDRPHLVGGQIRGDRSQDQARITASAVAEWFSSGLSFVGSCSIARHLLSNDRTFGSQTHLLLQVFLCDSRTVRRFLSNTCVPVKSTLLALTDLLTAFYVVSSLTSALPVSAHRKKFVAFFAVSAIISIEANWLTATRLPVPSKVCVSGSNREIKLISATVRPA